MKFSAQEEYGLRCLLRIAYSKSPNGITIPEISEIEKLSQSNVAKLLRILRLGGFVESARGQAGGYKLTKSPEKIIIGDVLNLLGGKLFESSFCSDHTGFDSICTHTIDCSVRSLWKGVQNAVDYVLQRTTLKDLMMKEQKVDLLVQSFVDDFITQNSLLKN